jgi:hypothetical protein
MGKDIGDYNIRMLNKMSSVSSHNVDIIVYNNVDYGKLKDKFNYKHTFGKNNCGLNFLCVLDAYSKYGDKYDYYMFYEEDLAYIGKKNIFDCIDYNYDMIFQSRRRLNYYWPWVKGNLNNIVRKGFRPYEGLLNIYLMKTSLLKDIKGFIEKGNWAHHEYLINSFVMTNSNKYSIGYLDDIFKMKCDWRPIKIDSDNYEFLHPIKGLIKIQKYF